MGFDPQDLPDTGPCPELSLSGDTNQGLSYSPGVKRDESGLEIKLHSRGPTSLQKGIIYTGDIKMLEISDSWSKFDLFWRDKRIAM
jgi:hypothetical protein